MFKIPTVSRYNTLKIVISLMHLSLNENRFTFYVNYFIIISLCNLSKVFITKMNSVNFAIKIQSPKWVPWNLQFLDLPKSNISSANNSANKVIELPAWMNPFTVICRAFCHLSGTTNEHLYMLLKLIIK